MTEAPPSYEHALAQPRLQPTHAGASTTSIPHIVTLAEQVAHATSPNSSNVQDHLILLKSFHQLQITISNIPGLFGYATTSELDCQKRWAVYVVRAVDRFQAWWDTLPGEPVTASGLNERLATFGGWFIRRSEMHAALPPHSQIGLPIEEVGGEGMALDADTLPPLDVIMVWYAMLQNPRNFLLDTIRHGKHEFWATDLPLKLIV